MKTRLKLAALFLQVLLALGGGCATSALWDNGRLDACKEPASNLNLRLYEAKADTNLLVLYDEFSERNESVRTRAYWLNENQTRVDQRLAPRFTRTNALRHLPSVPVFYEPIAAGTNWPAGLCAVVATNRQSFTLYLAKRPVGSHDLPVYNDGEGQVERIALTPVTAAADLTIVGGFLVCWYLLIRGGYPGP
jgi:hypothetical protein